MNKSKLTFGKCFKIGAGVTFGYLFVRVLLELGDHAADHYAYHDGFFKDKNLFKRAEEYSKK